MVTQTQSNLLTMRKLFIVAAAMFGFGFALVPFYKQICEVTGGQ
jgi:cytochrome c oxidase assembly protein subunit 11